MRFHLIDQLISYDKWKNATAIKNVTKAQNVFLENDSTFSNTLMLESIFQTAAWLVVCSSNQKFRPTIISFSKFKVYRDIEVGNQLRIEVSVEPIDELNIAIEGRVYIDTDLVAEINYALLHLLESKDLENKSETKIYMNFLLRQTRGDTSEI
ncbi:hypothetical protein [Paraliobacillus sp. JSM ZJ581]|uniref:hypothetical protein n=1 Tax=Paraliobacillus sp. JSM ZJ581 TaxID=3342118 RepID=UPI0035A838FE